MKKQRSQAKETVVQSIDAVREVMVNLLTEHQQSQTTTQQTTTSRGSRLNNTIGVNITDEDFLKSIQEKELNKTKKQSGKQKTVSFEKTKKFSFLVLIVIKKMI